MHHSVTFVFSNEERQQALQEGQRRQQVNETKKLKGRNKGASVGSEALKIHLLGAAGEMAVASYLNLKNFLYLEKEANRNSVDLPGNIDVKTRSKHTYDLIIQRNENPDKRFVLVTIENKQTLIHGWCYGKDGMKEEFWADPARGRPAYFVPKTVLKDISILLQLQQA